MSDGIRIQTVTGFGRTGDGNGFLIIHGHQALTITADGGIHQFTDGFGHRVISGRLHGFTGAITKIISAGIRKHRTIVITRITRTIGDGQATTGIRGRLTRAGYSPATRLWKLSGVTNIS